MNIQQLGLMRKISLRPVILPDDEELLKKIYSSIREDLQMLALPAGELMCLLQMQYQAQQRQYAFQYPNAVHEICLLDGIPIGRLIVNYESEEMCAVDLALLTEYRNSGIGTILIRKLLDKAAETERAFTLHVEKTNRAARLYTRLGCRIVGDTGTHYKMQWQPVPVNSHCQ